MQPAEFDEEMEDRSQQNKVDVAEKQDAKDKEEEEEEEEEEDAIDEEGETGTEDDTEAKAIGDQGDEAVEAAKVPDANGNEVQHSECRYCAESIPHPLWVFLLRVTAEGEQQVDAKWTATIDISANPRKTLNEHNGVRGFTRGPQTKQTRKHRSYWSLWMVIGPFTSNDATEFAEDWRNNSRTQPKRFAYGIKLFKAWRKTDRGKDLRLYCTEPSAVES
jgi:hypothetical protein